MPPTSAIPSLRKLTFVAGCGGCSVDVHIYANPDGGSLGESCIVRQLHVNDNVFTTATFSQCGLTPGRYYYAQIFNLDAPGMSVYLVDDSGGRPDDFATAFCVEEQSHALLPNWK